jgi:hypothetical protein
MPKSDFWFPMVGCLLGTLVLAILVAKGKIK